MVVNHFQKPILLAAICFCISAWTCVAFAANIRATIDRHTVQENESFYLEFTSAEDVDDDPDFNPLNQDFRVVSRNQSSNIQIINGRMTRQWSWQLMLMPLKTGKLTIPSIAFGKDKSPAIIVHVTPAPVNQSGQISGLLHIESDAKPKSAYVHSQILLTIRIYHALNLINASLSDIKISNNDAFIEKLEENKVYEKIINNERYKVIERSFAIFPQKEGSLTIEPVVFDVQYIDRRRLLHNKVVSTKPIEIQVKSIPPMQSKQAGDAWLPANKLVLEEQWPDNLTQINVGEPVTRTLRLTAHGLNSAQIPKLNRGEINEQVKQYPDQPVLKDQKTAQGLIAIREEKVAYIPTKPGRITLPAIEIPWWNVEKDYLEVAKLPSLTIDVRAAPGSAQTQAPTAQSFDAGGDPSVDVADIPTPVTFDGMSSSVWFWVSMVTILGWIATLVALLAVIQRMNKSSSDNDVVFYQNSRRVNAVLQQLKGACNANQAQQAKEALLQWAKLTWDKHAPQSIGELCKHVDGPLHKELLKLNDVLYNPNPPAWNGTMLWMAMTLYNKQIDKQAYNDASVLPPLYKMAANI